MESRSSSPVYLPSQPCSPFEELLPFASPTQGWTLFSLPLHTLSVPSWGFQDEDRPLEDMGQYQLRSGCLGKDRGMLSLGQQVSEYLPAGAA